MRDPFDVPSGEFTEDFTGTLSGVDFRAGDYGTQVVVTVTLDEPVAKNDGTLMTEKSVYIRVPADWSSRDGGLTLDKVSNGVVDEDAKITRKSQWGDFIGRLDDLGVDRRGLNLTAYSTAGWSEAGLHGRFETVDVGRSYPERTDKRTGELIPAGKTKGYVAMTELLGQGDAKPAGGGGFKLGDLNLSDDTVDNLMALAQAQGDAEEFKVEALSFRSHAEDKQAFVAALQSGELYEALR